MKSRTVVISKWLAHEGENIDIDWPAVQREAGKEHVEWLLKQPREKCQLIVEQRPDDSYLRLVAEFYDDSLAVNYHLLWAK